MREEQGASRTLLDSLEAVVRSGVGLAECPRSPPAPDHCTLKSWLLEAWGLRKGWAPVLAGHLRRDRALDLESGMWLLLLEVWRGWPGLTCTCFSGLLGPDSQATGPWWQEDVAVRPPALRPGAKGEDSGTSREGSPV